MSLNSKIAYGGQDSQKKFFIQVKLDLKKVENQLR